jgi:D-alanine-D-alanine ligase
LNIGITYDLRDEYLAEGYGEMETAEFDRADTIQAIEGALLQLGHEVCCIGNIRSLVGCLAEGECWDMVFNIAEGLAGFGREAQIPALLEAYRIPYTFSDPLVLSLSLHKGMAKHIVRSLSIPTPDFVILDAPEDISKVKLPFPLFAKPVAEGTGKGIDAASKINSQEELEQVCERIFEMNRQPVIIEAYLPGREFTVGIAGTGKDAVALGVAEIFLKDHAEQNAYSYVNKERCEELVEYRLVYDLEAEKAKESAIAVWRGLGCRDAGRVDLRSDISGLPNFMEVNPLSGLHPHHSDLPILCNMKGIAYGHLIGMIIDSACRRFNGAAGDAQ